MHCQRNENHFSRVTFARVCVIPTASSSASTSPPPRRRRQPHRRPIVGVYLTATPSSASTTPPPRHRPRPAANKAVLAHRRYKTRRAAGGLGDATLTLQVGVAVPKPVGRGGRGAAAVRRAFVVWMLLIRTVDPRPAPVADRQLGYGAVAYVRACTYRFFFFSSPLTVPPPPPPPPLCGTTNGRQRFSPARVTKTPSGPPVHDPFLWGYCRPSALARVLADGAARTRAHGGGGDRIPMGSQTAGRRPRPPCSIRRVFHAFRILYFLLRPDVT